MFEGHWIEGKRSGEGRIIYPNGTIKSGLWQNDKRMDDEGKSPRTAKKTESPFKLVEKALIYSKQKENRTYK